MSEFKYVIIGGGMVAGYAAKRFVELGLKPGELAIVSADDALPYERPPLSKDFLMGTATEEDTCINPPSFYDEAGIEVRLSTAVTRINATDRTLSVDNGDDVRFEKLLIASGSHVRLLNAPGATLSGIMYLRSIGDARRLRDAYRHAKRAVVIGGGFIGMEVASVLARQGVETTMLFPEDRVWSRFFTPEMSAFFERYYAGRGVSFAPNELIASIDGEGSVSGVVTKSGRKLPADLVVAGIGVTPSTDFLDSSGIECDDGVLVNEFLETNVKNIWAAGDVARYQDAVFGQRRRVEHWDNAVEQGKHAAEVMFAKRRAFEHVPYFFSDVFDLSYEFWGDSAGATDVLYRGDVSTSSFSAWWLKGERLVAAFVMNRPDEERDAAQAWIADAAAARARLGSL